MSKFLNMMMIGATCLLVSTAAQAGSSGDTEFNDWQSQFNAQKEAIKAQSSGQWINGKQRAEEERPEGSLADHSDHLSGDYIPVTPDYESNSSQGSRYHNNTPFRSGTVE